MSVVAIFVGEGFAVVGGDGVCTDINTGNVAGYMSKMILLPHLSAVLTYTGLSTYGAHLFHAIQTGVEDFDGLADALPMLLLRAHVEILASGRTDISKMDTCIGVAGWSERDGKAKAYRIVNYDKLTSFAGPSQGASLAPWVMHEIKTGQQWGTTGYPELLNAFGVNDPEIDCPVERIVRFISAARAHSGESIDGVTFNAGGYVQLAVIQQDRVEGTIIHRWPEDVVGNPIDPNKGVPLPPIYRKERDSHLSWPPEGNA